VLDHDEAAFLGAIAARYEDDSVRLVFADWLDERGETSRAEFLRLQCELATEAISEERRRTLRLRECEILDANWTSWLADFKLPVEDVEFERGLISRMRLSRWDRSILEPENAASFATITELDMSDLVLGDEGLTAFAEKADFPALKKLIISNNAISDVGVSALAKSKALSKLETVYLFGNRISENARFILKRAEHFQLKNLDLGKPAEGYAMSTGQAEMARRQYIRKELLPVVLDFFQKYEGLRSAMLCVAQYWSDEATDAVHGNLIVSELFEPKMEGVQSYADESDPDINLPNLKIKIGYHWGSVISLWDAKIPWDDNHDAIPLWAAFAPEGADQGYDKLSDAYSPAAMFYRYGGYEILPMIRPELDGVRPEEEY
jgi:uncharacterized protein (TIGR02996 family)